MYADRDTVHASNFATSGSYIELELGFFHRSRGGVRMGRHSKGKAFAILALDPYKSGPRSHRLGIRQRKRTAAAGQDPPSSLNTLRKLHSRFFMPCHALFDELKVELHNWNRTCNPGRKLSTEDAS